MGVRDADRAVRRLVREKLFSLRGGAADSVDDVARMTGTINYEVLC